MGHWPLGDRAVVDERCTLADLGKAIHTRDALDIGFPDQVGCRDLGTGDRHSLSTHLCGFLLRAYLRSVLGPRVFREFSYFVCLNSIPGFHLLLCCCYVVGPRSPLASSALGPSRTNLGG